MSRYNITPEQLLEELDNNKMDDKVLIDVREPEEWEYYRLEPAMLIPLQTLPERLTDIPSDRMLYLICAHGVRSAAACNYLLSNGFHNLKNVSGGMSAVASIKGDYYD